MRKMPVELTSTSTRPKRSTAAATSACACSRVVTWPAWIVDALAAGVERVLRGLELGLARAAEDDARALGEEALGGGAADAATAAGDQDDLVLELHGGASGGR